jgi:hypothetical protein
MRLYWEVRSAGVWSTPQFEEDYRSQLKGYVSVQEFESVVTTVNRIWRSAGSGLINRGCLLLCFCCCFVIMRRDNREALDDVRYYVLLLQSLRHHHHRSHINLALRCHSMWCTGTI